MRYLISHLISIEIDKKYTVDLGAGCLQFMTTMI